MARAPALQRALCGDARTLVLIASALAYALSVNLLSMFEGTMCLRFAGGSGCGEDG